jgi:ubiquinol-cytochrome c reductase cytochrome b subunit
MLSIPVVGSYMAFFLFGGNFPGTSIIPRFFILHVLIIPLVILGLVGAHMGLLVRQKHTQFPGKGKTEKNVVGTPMYPVFMAKTTGFMFVVAGFTALLGAFAQINPIWQFGPYTASRISYAVQPDWYMGFLDGLLRIFPAWSFHSFGYTIPLEVTIPAVIFPGILFNLVMAWPTIERKFTKDNELHNLLDRPSNRPKRTAAGVTVAVLLAMLHIASSTDVMANFFHVSLNTVLWTMRILCIVVPILAYPVTYKICREMQGFSGAGKRKTTNIVTRTTAGEYLATPAPVYVDDLAHEHEHDAVPVPTFVVDDEDTVDAEDMSGVRRIPR